VTPSSLIPRFASFFFFFFFKYNPSICTASARRCIYAHVCTHEPVSEEDGLSSIGAGRSRSHAVDCSPRA
jgi:hypothetical protein